MRIKSVVFAVALLLLTVVSTFAFTIDYVGTSGAYSVDSVSGHNVKETYGATFLSGNQVVDISGGSTFYFDKVVTLGRNDIKKNFEMTFKVDNTGPFTWSDYHFIVGEGPTVTSGQSADFKGVTLTGNRVDFYYDPPGGRLVAPGETLNMNLSFDTRSLCSGDTFTVQQVATVPVPDALVLFGSGLLVILGRRKCDDMFRSLFPLC